MKQTDFSPKVSVLVPVYNGDRYLKECLESICGQDYPDLEILIADDQSTDGSFALAQSFAARDSRIRLWRNDQNLGLAANFNCCLRAAQGKYVKFVLQDDKLISPQAVRKMAAVLERDADVSLVAAASYILDEDSHTLEKRSHFKPGTSSGEQVIIRCLEQPANLIGEPSVVMFRRAAPDVVFDEGYRQLLDLDYWFQLLELGCFGYLEEPLAGFRKHERQQTALNKVGSDRGDEGLRLLARWYPRPWLQSKASRRLLFAQAYTLRNATDPRAGQLVAQLRGRLGGAWYACFWLQRKLFRPFQKFGQKLRSQLLRSKTPQPLSQSR